MPQTTNRKTESKSRRRDDASEPTPSLNERGESGMRIAEHLQKAAAGGKIRKGFSLWQISKELPTAAAGAGEVFKRHPIPIALLGGAVTTAALLYAAHSMGAFEAEEGADEQDGEEPERSDDEEEGEDADE